MLRHIDTGLENGNIFQVYYKLRMLKVKIVKMRGYFCMNAQTKGTKRKSIVKPAYKEEMYPLINS